MKAGFNGSAMLVPALALVSLVAQGQELTLFQDAQGNNQRGQFAQMPPAVFEAPSAPTLRLKGIYRFGDTYHVSLQSEEGATYKATWTQGQNTGVSVGGYQIQGVDNKTVTLGMPSGVSCQQNLESGNSCLGRSQVALSFAVSEPVSARRNGSNNRGRNATFTFNNSNDNDNGRTRGGVDRDELRALLEAANNGSAEAREAAQNALREAIGTRGGRGGFGGGRGGFGGDDDD